MSLPGANSQRRSNTMARRTPFPPASNWQLTPLNGGVHNSRPIAIAEGLNPVWECTYSTTSRDRTTPFANGPTRSMNADCSVSRIFIFALYTVYMLSPQLLGIAWYCMRYAVVKVFSRYHYAANTRSRQAGALPGIAIFTEEKQWKY